jgi:formylglycine-generating enzyme required for sulfatase activity
MGYNNSENKNCNDCPVENVSWNEVNKFIETLNESSEVKFRLPTSAEWDYVVRMDVREYIDKRGGPRYGDNVAWNENNSERKTHSVGTRIPHRSGAYDLMGNVAEWCSDWYDAEYLKSNKNAVNPTGPATGTTKIVRGGTYANNDFIELQHRDPKEKAKNIGFRLVQY